MTRIVKLISLVQGSLTHQLCNYNNFSNFMDCKCAKYYIYVKCFERNAFDAAVDNP